MLFISRSLMLLEAGRGGLCVLDGLLEIKDLCVGKGSGLRSQHSFLKQPSSSRC